MSQTKIKRTSIEEVDHRFLVSTHNHLFIFGLKDDLSKGAVSPVASGARYYGIATAPDGAVWIAKNTRRSEDISEIVKLQTSEVLEFETPLADIHQITAYGDGLYICNTYYNSVVYKGLRDGREHIHTIGGAFEHDYAHPNSLWVDPPYVYVLLHNKRFRTSEVARLVHDPERGFEEGYRREVRYALPHQACHNIRFDRAVLTYLASENEAVVQMNHLTGSILRLFPIGTEYAKGMTTFGENRILIGMNPLVPAKARYDCHSSLGIVNIQDGGLECTFDVTFEDGSPIGNVNEIRRISPSPGAKGIDAQASVG